MARFDISGSVGRGFGQIEEKSRNMAIRKELEPISKVEDMAMKRQEPLYQQSIPASQELDPLLSLIRYCQPRSRP
jgi:hypothetical protein